MRPNLMWDRLVACGGLSAPLAVFLISTSALGAATTITFEPNAGQIGKSVDWVVRQGSGTPMFLRATGAAISQYHQGRADFVELRFDGARPDAASTGEAPLDSYSNYYLGRDEHTWFTGIPHFARVRYRDVYPGIDVVYHANGAEIEYDFDVRPSADPSQIHISFHGIDSFHINHGDVVLTSNGRELRQRRPRVFQNGREIDASYRISASHVEIALAAFDPTCALLIDPAIQFASYLGGPGLETAQAIRVDSQGYIYIAGSNQSIVSPGLNPFSQSGLIVISPIIFKFTPDGKSLVFFLTLTVDNRTVAESLAIDSVGNLMIAGETTALQLPLKNAIDSTFKAQVATVFAAKWTADGRTLVYSTYFGGTGSEHARAGAAVDAAGNLYFAGVTSSQDLPVVNALQPKHAGGGPGIFPGGLLWSAAGAAPLDCYVTKLSPEGQLVFSTYLGGSDDDYCFAMSLAPDGGVVLGGYSSGIHFPLVNAMLTPSGGGAAFISQSPVIAKLQGDGQALNFSTYICEYSGPSIQFSNILTGSLSALAVDSSGNIYAAGNCASGLATKNAVLSSIPNLQLGSFVMALNSTGQNILYRTYLDNFATPASSSITGMAVDAQGSAYVAGWTTNQNFPATNSFQPFQGGPSQGVTGSDFFLTRLAPSGSSLIFSTFLGGNSLDYSPVLDVASDGSVYFAGTTESTNIPVKNAFQSNFGGGSDVVFMKTTDAAIQAGPPSAIVPFGGTPQAAVVNAAFAARLQVRVTDSAGNPVSGVTVTFSAPATGASAALSAVSAQTDLSGGASVTATANGITGSYTVIASAASVTGTASFALTNANANVTVETSPAGLSFIVDGATYTSSQSFFFPPGSSHLLGIPPVESSAPGARAAFGSWSDGQPAMHLIAATNTLTTYTASFTQQYQLTTAVSPAGSGTITPASGTYYNAGSTVTVTAAPTGSLTFNSWTGPVTAIGPLTGTVVMNAPINVIANFGAATQPASTISALLNSASYAAGPVAPNEFLAAFGSFPACATSNAQVTVDSMSAQVLYASSNQVNFLMPPVAAASAVRIACPGSTPTPFPITLAAAAPGLFTVSQDGKGQIAVVNQDYSINTPSPAGSYIAVYGTGFGSYDPPASDALTHLAFPVTGVLTAGSGPSYPVNVVFAGQAPGYSAGLQQINLQVPANVPAGVFQLVLTAGSASTQTTATLQVTQSTASTREQ